MHNSLNSWIRFSRQQPEVPGIYEAADSKLRGIANIYYDGKDWRVNVLDLQFRIYDVAYWRFIKKDESIDNHSNNS